MLVQTTHINEQYKKQCPTSILEASLEQETLVLGDRFKEPLPLLHIDRFVCSHVDNFELFSLSL